MRAETITSRKNPLMQKIRRLTGSRKARQDEGLYISDGTKLLLEAIRWCSGLDTVILTDGVEVPDIPEGVAVYRVPEDVMESISPMKTPQGAVFLCRIPERKLGMVTPGTLVLEGIQDPGNLGTILRTANALDVPVILANGCADPYNWKSVRASMGAVFRTEPAFLSSASVLESCQERGMPLAVTALSHRAMDIRSVRLNDFVTVIGSEGQGVSPLFLEHCDKELIIPMNPCCESLNAATAATIVMWQLKQSG